MRLTSFGMFAIMRETTTKIWDWRNILTGIIRLVMIMQEKRSLLGENIFHFLIHTVVIGDIKGIRKEKNLGRKTNQKLHSLPYARNRAEQYKNNKSSCVTHLGSSTGVMDAPLKLWSYAS